MPYKGLSFCKKTMTQSMATKKPSIYDSQLQFTPANKLNAINLQINIDVNKA